MTHSELEIGNRLKSAETMARIQTAKLEHQMKRYHKLDCEVESLKQELAAQKERFEQALAQEKRQKDLVLNQMADLEKEYLAFMDEWQAEGPVVDKLKSENAELRQLLETKAQENSKLKAQVVSCQESHLKVVPDSTLAKTG